MDEMIARIERATEGSRELDAEIMFDLYAKPVGKHKEDGGPRGYLWPEDNPSWSFGHRFPGKDRAWFKEVRKGQDETLVIERDGALVLMNSLRVPRLTTNIADAMALLPDGAEYAISTLYGVAYVELPLNFGDKLPEQVRREDGNVILAFVTACLRARSTHKGKD